MIASASAAVIGARHLRIGRNGQDAAARWCDGDAGALVVCDGCSAGGSSEVGARLGAQLVIAAIASALRAGEAASAIWRGVRERVVGQLGQLVEAMPGDRMSAVAEHMLFTVVAAAWSGDELVVWSMGDGAYALGRRVTVLGPFADNQPPYLAYDLLGSPQAARLEVASTTVGQVAVATDGIAELGLDAFMGCDAIDHYLRHPDALRRRLTLLARADEKIDWDAHRIERRPAALQDDGAIAIARWS